jgi:hypothetical protein
MKQTIVQNFVNKLILSVELKAMLQGLNFIKLNPSKLIETNAPEIA